MTGTAGVLGHSLMNLLMKNRYRIRALDLFMPKNELMKKGINVKVGDIADKVILKKAPSVIGFVFHLAANLHINYPTPELNAEFERVNVQGTRSLAGAARDS